MPCQLAFLAVLVCQLGLNGQRPANTAEPPGKSPEESLKSIQVEPGFKVELAATEPLVKDPIAFEWGADGKLWVVEMGDYPLGVDGKGKPGGVVRFLEDTDGDGRYDKQTTFLDGLGFPTGVMPWRNGVLVACAPDIFYAEDRDGDGKADHREVLYHRLWPGEPAAPVERLRAGPGRLGLWCQRRQRRHGPLAEDGQGHPDQRPRFPVSARHRRLRGRERPDPVRPAPRRLGPLVRQQQPQLGLALRPRQPRPQAQSLTTPPPDPRQTLEPDTRLLSDQPHARPVQRPRHGQPRHVGQQPDALPRRPLRPRVCHQPVRQRAGAQPGASDGARARRRELPRPSRAERGRTASSSPPATTGSGRPCSRPAPTEHSGSPICIAPSSSTPNGFPTTGRSGSTSAPAANRGGSIAFIRSTRSPGRSHGWTGSIQPSSWPRSTAPAAGSATRPSGCSCTAAIRPRSRRCELWRRQQNGPRRASRRSGRWPIWAASTSRRRWPASNDPDPEGPRGA